MIGPDRLKHLMEKHLEDFNLIDVRAYEDYIKGHIPYAVHIPYDQMEEQLVKLSKDKVNILYSHSFLCQKSKKKPLIYLRMKDIRLWNLWADLKAGKNVILIL